MARNVLFLVHGIGDQKTGWSRSAQAILSAEFDRYMHHSGKRARLSEELRFVEITYNDIFRAVWRRWSALASALDPAAGVPGPIAKVNRFLGPATATTGSQLGNNRAVDFTGNVLLYVGFRLVRRLVLLKVMSIVASAVEEAREADLRTEFGVLSHSLGTAVAHDALHTLATSDWSGGRWGRSARQDLGDAEAAFRSAGGRLTEEEEKTLGRIRRQIGPRAFSPGRLQFAGLFTIANLSRAAGRTADPYRSVVRPSPADLTSPVRGNTDAFFDIAHDLDPVAKLREFDTSGFGDTTGRAVDVSVSHLYARNVHSLDHYLINPKAHRLVFRRLCPSFGDRESEYADRRFSEELKAEGHPDFFPRRGGDFSAARIAREMRERYAKHISEALEAVL